MFIFHEKEFDLFKLFGGQSQQARAPILVRAGGGLISIATTADRFPITDKR